MLTFFEARAIRPPSASSETETTPVSILKLCLSGMAKSGAVEASAICNSSFCGVSFDVSATFKVGATSVEKAVDKLLLSVCSAKFSSPLIQSSASFSAYKTVPSVSLLSEAEAIIVSVVGVSVAPRGASAADNLLYFSYIGSFSSVAANSSMFFVSRASALFSSVCALKDITIYTFVAINTATSERKKLPIKYFKFSFCIFKIP